MEDHYDIAVEEISSIYGWTEGTPLFSERVKFRHHNWWRNHKRIWQKDLSDKLTGESFCTKLGVPIVPKIMVTESYDDARLLHLPPHYVIKTDKGTNSKQVFPVRDGINLFTNEKITITEILDTLANDNFLENKEHQIIVEELVKDEFGNDIPLDYKFYMYGGKIALVQVIDRPTKIESEQFQGYYDAYWNKIPISIRPRRKEIDGFKKPKHFDEMSDAAVKLGSKLGIFMRIDFYTTKQGFYFGEFTPTPNMGKGYSPEGDKLLGGFWIDEEGVEGTNPKKFFLLTLAVTTWVVISNPFRRAARTAQLFWKGETNGKK